MIRHKDQGRRGTYTRFSSFLRSARVPVRLTALPLDPSSPSLNGVSSCWSGAALPVLLGALIVCWSLWPGIQVHCNAADQKNSPEVSDPVASADQAYDHYRFEEATRLYTTALKKEPGAGSIYFRRAMALEMLDRNSQAVADYLKAVELNPQDFKAMENLAGIYERDGHFAEAISLYRKALELDPRPVWQENLAVWIAMLDSRSRGEASSAVAAWHLGNKKAKSGDLEGALADYTQAANLDPGMFQAFHNRALVKLRLNDFLGALKDLDATIEICPTLRGALVLRGLARERVGDRARALMDFRRATRIDPRDPRAHYELGRMHEEEMEPAEALSCYEEALRLKPKPELRTMVQSRAAQVRTAAGSRLNRRSKPATIIKDMW